MIKIKILGIIILFLSSFFPFQEISESKAIAGKNGRQTEFTFTVVLNEDKCQMAIWLVNEHGKFEDTVYITAKIARKGLGNRKGELDDMFGGARLSALPVWAYNRGVDYGGGNYYPPEDKPLPDAVTSASPDAGKFIWHWKPGKKLKPGKYYYYIEANKSFDENKHHDYSWYRGQPSVVWKGELIVGNKISKSSAELIGHGHPAGADGSINPDVSTLTTALKLIGKAEAVYTPGTN